MGGLEAVVDGSMPEQEGPFGPCVKGERAPIFRHGDWSKSGSSAPARETQFVGSTAPTRASWWGALLTLWKCTTQSCTFAFTAAYSSIEHLPLPLGDSCIPSSYPEDTYAHSTSGLPWYPWPSRHIDAHCPFRQANYV